MIHIKIFCEFSRRSSGFILKFGSFISCNVSVNRPWAKGHPKASHLDIDGSIQMLEDKARGPKLKFWTDCYLNLLFTLLPSKRNQKRVMGMILQGISYPPETESAYLHIMETLVKTVPGKRVTRGQTLCRDISRGSHGSHHSTRLKKS